MFTLMEHYALMRLMRLATGFTLDSKYIACWLQEWEQLDDPRVIEDRVSGVSDYHASDLQMVAQAVKRTGAKPSTLGRLEYGYKMESIARANPLPEAECER